MKKQKSIGVGCALAVSLLVSSNVSAAVTDYTTGATLSGSDNLSVFDTGFLNVPDSITLSGLPQFNSSMGTLNVVTLSIDGSIDYSLDIQGVGLIDGTSPNQAGVTTELGIGAGVPLSGSFSLEAAQTDFISIGCFEGSSQTGGPCMDFTADTLPIASNAAFTGADLAAFIGSGNLNALSIDLLFGVDNDGFVDNLLDASVGAQLDFNGTVSVEYDYSPVPVPAAIWLFGSALLGLVGVAKGKKA